MKTVGRRQERKVTFTASGEMLAEGARFNEEIHRLPTGNQTFIPKGVRRFKSHEEANRYDEECLARAMVRIAMERS